MYCLKVLQFRDIEFIQTEVFLSDVCEMGVQITSDESKILKINSKIILKAIAEAIAEVQTFKYEIQQL